MMKKKIIYLHILFIFFAGCLPIEKLSLQSTPTPSSPHIILENGLGLVQLWETNGIVMRKINQETPLFFLGDYLALVDLSKDELAPRLLGFDVQTGRSVWETPLSDGSFSFLSDQTSIIVGAKYSLLSYDVSTGLLNWENKELPSMKIYAMQIDSGDLYAYYDEVFLDNNTQVIYTIDTRTGKLLETQKIPNPVSLWRFQTHDAGYGTKGNEVLSIDKGSLQVRWKTTLDTFATHWGAIGQETIVTTAHMDDALFAIDMQNGRLKWQYTQQLISNPSIENDSVFALIAGEELIRLNLDTGEKIGSARFTQPNNPNDENSNNLIAVSGDLVAIYFADSYQLVVYKISK
jgi:outer membrane protein assembly factor BamB